MSAIAVDVVVLSVGIALVLGVVLLVLLIVAPWKSVRSEPPLDEEIEMRLLLGEDPRQIAADEDAENAARGQVRDLDDRADDSATLADLSALADLEELDRLDGHIELSDGND